MSTRWRLKTPARHALRLGGLLIVLGGLFGMHGLSGHGTAAVDAMPRAEMVRTPMDMFGLSHAPTPTGETLALPSTRNADSVAPALDAPGHHPGMTMSMFAICLAVLVSLLIALLGLLGSSRLPFVLWALPRVANGPEFLGRDPDPPSLIDLSSLRC